RRRFAAVPAPVLGRIQHRAIGGSLDGGSRRRPRLHHSRFPLEERATTEHRCRAGAVPAPTRGGGGCRACLVLPSTSDAWRAALATPTASPRDSTARWRPGLE